MGVWLVTGVQAAGKSTVADLLAGQFDRGVHVRGGAGFTVVAQDNIFGADVVAWLHQVKATPQHLVVLRPSAARPPKFMPPWYPRGGC